MKKKQDPVEIYLQPIGQWSNDDLLKASDGITKLLEDGVYLEDIKVLINGDRIDEGDEFFRSKTMLNGFIWSNKIRVELGIRLEKALNDNKIATNNASLFQKLMGDPNKISSAEEAIIDQMMNDTTDDGLKELEMADEADKAVEERAKMAILTDDKGEPETLVSTEYLCQNCGSLSVMESKNMLLCMSCHDEKKIEYFVDNDGKALCPNCGEILEGIEATGQCECPQCSFICTIDKFDNPVTKDESGLLEASGLSDEQILATINSKATQETVDKIMGEIVEIAVSEEIKDKRRKQLLIGGFFLKDGEFNLEDKVFRPASILELSDEDFEVEMKAIFEEKRLYYLEKDNLTKEKATKPAELPRSICSVCGKYAWNKDMINGKCPNCYKEKTPVEFKSTPPLTKEESFKTPEDEKKIDTKESAHIPPNEEEPKGNNSSEDNVPIITKEESGGQLKMPWE